MNKEGYTEWLKKHNISEATDYNTKDAYLAGLTPDERGHLPDTFKMPNHITYSDESVYSQHPEAPPPGKWRQGSDGKWVFWASPTNVQNAGGLTKLQQYFREKEPDATLIFPSYSAIDALFGNK